MHGGHLRELAEKALLEAAPKDFDLRGYRLNVLPQDGTLILFFASSQAVRDPISLLRENAVTSKGLPAPYVIDLETGVSARRFVVPHSVWTRPESFRKVLDGEDFHNSSSVISSLRLWKKIGRELNTYRYGRSGRLTLYLDTSPPLLAARVFSGGLLLRPGSSPCIPEGRTTRLALVLLARTGASARPYPFHRLQGEHFLHVERAAHIQSTAGRETLKNLENELIRGAEEDREIIHALLSSGVPWEELQAEESNHKEWRSGNERKHESS